MKKIIRNIIIIAILIAANFFYALTTSKSLAIYDKEVASDKYGSVGQIAENTVITQTFKCKEDGFNAIEIMFSTFERENDTTISYEISDEGGKTIVKGYFDESDLEHYKFYEIEFDKISKSKGKEYTLTLKDKNTVAGAAVSILTTKETQKNELKVAGNYAEKVSSSDSLVMKVITTKFDLETFIVLSFFELFIYAFIRTIYKFLR